VSVEADFQSTIKELDQKAHQLYQDKGPGAAVELVTQRCGALGDSLVQTWNQFFGELFMKYRDGYIITKDDTNKACGCAPGNAPYSLDWNDRIVKDTGDHYRVPAEEQLVHGMKGGASARSAAKLRLLQRR
jgi:hypothetical protein